MKEVTDVSRTDLTFPALFWTFSKLVSTVLESAESDAWHVLYCMQDTYSPLICIITLIQSSLHSKYAPAPGEQFKCKLSDGRIGLYAFTAAGFLPSVSGQPNR